MHLWFERSTALVYRQKEDRQQTTNPDTCNFTKRWCTSLFICGSHEVILLLWIETMLKLQCSKGMIEVLNAWSWCKGIKTNNKWWLFRQFADTYIRFRVQISWKCRFTLIYPWYHTTTCNLKINKTSKSKHNPHWIKVGVTKKTSCCMSCICLQFHWIFTAKYVWQCIHYIVLRLNN